MDRRYNYEINFAGAEKNAPRSHYKGQVQAATVGMAAHRAVLQARQGSGNKKRFDMVTEMFISIRGLIPEKNDSASDDPEYQTTEVST
jgi:hypothetical protein